VAWPRKRPFKLAFVINEKAIAEDEMLDRLVDLIDVRLKLSLVTPDYRKLNPLSRCYQWRVQDGWQFYRLPKGGKVVALRLVLTNECWFSERGFVQYNSDWNINHDQMDQRRLDHHAKRRGADGTGVPGTDT
jgi:hypothetical protein